MGLGAIEIVPFTPGSSGPEKELEDKNFIQSYCESVLLDRIHDMTDQTNEPKILRFKETGSDETHVQVQENSNQTQDDHISQVLLEDDSSNNHGQSSK